MGLWGSLDWYKTKGNLASRPWEPMTPVQIRVAPFLTKNKNDKKSWKHWPFWSKIRQNCS